jgi:hypothetical protein
MVIRVDFSKCRFNHFKVFEEMGFEAGGAFTAISTDSLPRRRAVPFEGVWTLV